MQMRKLKVRRTLAIVLMFLLIPMYGNMQTFYCKT